MVADGEESGGSLGGPNAVDILGSIYNRGYPREKRRYPYY